VKVTNEKTENRQAFLTIEMEPSEVEESLEKAYNRLVKKTNIPGFRKGKAPRAVLERHIGSENLFENALDALLPEAYEKAIEEQKIEAFAQPRAEIAQTDPVVFKVTIPLPPVIKLGDYQHIKVAPEPVEITEDDVSTAMEQLRHQHATWESVERPVDYADMVVFDIESSIEGSPFINQKGAQYQVIRDHSLPMPGFAEQLIGISQGEEKEFKLQFPSDYSKGELAGKEPLFKLKVTEVKQEVLPELNDEFAREVNPDFDNLNSLREQVSSDMKLRADEKARMDFEQRVIDAAVELAEVEFPPVLVEAEINYFLRQRFQGGSQEIEAYLSSTNRTEEQLREEIRPQATRRVTQSLVLGKINEEGKIEVSDSEVDTEIESLTKNAGESKDGLTKFFNTMQSRESIKQSLVTRKTVQRLVEIATSNKTEGSVD